MAELHIIGTISGATNYPKPDLCCKWTVITGDGWNLLEGNSSGQTHVDLPINQTTTIWDHPIDLHYSTKTIAGWPKLVVNVYYQDMFGRHELYGYGFTHLPTTPGHHQVEIPTWRPCGNTSEQIWTMFLGATPQLKDLNMIHDPTDRFRLITKSMGKVLCKFDIVVRISGNSDGYTCFDCVEQPPKMQESVIFEPIETEKIYNHVYAVIVGLVIVIAYYVTRKRYAKAIDVEKALYRKIE